MSTDNELPKSVLIVDRDAAFFQQLSDQLARHDISVSVANDLENAHEKFNSAEFDVVIIEMEFKPLSGLTIIQKWRNHPLVEKRLFGCILSSTKGRKDGEDGLMREIGDIITTVKPYSINQLLPNLRQAAEVKNKLSSRYHTRENILSYLRDAKTYEESILKIKDSLPKLGSVGLDMMLSAADSFSRHGDVLSSLKEMESSYNRPGTQLAVANAIARTLLKLKRLPEAKKYFEQLDMFAPGNIDRIAEMAELYLHMKLPDDAVGKMRSLITLKPEEPALKFDLFSQLYDHGFDEHAQSLCEETTQPLEIVRYYNNKGVMLSKYGESKSAIKEYEMALRYFPKFKDNYKIHFNLAIAYLASYSASKLLEARGQLESSLRLNPNLVKAVSLLETVRRLLKKSESLGTRLSQGVCRSPQAPNSNR